MGLGDSRRVRPAATDPAYITRRCTWGRQLIGPHTDQPTGIRARFPRHAGGGRYSNLDRAVEQRAEHPLTV